MSEHKPKRSSLKHNRPIEPNEIMNYPKKRNSVSWKIGSPLNFEAKFMNVEEKKLMKNTKKNLKKLEEKVLKMNFQLPKNF